MGGGQICPPGRKSAVFGKKNENFQKWMDGKSRLKGIFVTVTNVSVKKNFRTNLQHLLFRDVSVVFTNLECFVFSLYFVDDLPIYASQ